MTAPSSASGDSTLRANPNLLGVAAYLGGAVSGLLLLWLEKKNRFVRFHAAQSIVFSLAVSLVILLLASLPLVGRLASALGLLGAFVAWVYLMFKALDGQHYKMPYLGEFVDHQLR